MWPTKKGDGEGRLTLNKSKTPNHRLSVVFVLNLLFIVPKTFAQQTDSDSAAYQSELNNTVGFYKEQIGDQSPLNNGSHYAPFNFSFKDGSPYFLNGDFSNGSVVYDGIRFDSLSLLYEDLRDVLVVKNGPFLLQLISERIRSFTIDGHHFLRITIDSSDQKKFKTGFYEILYAGHVTLLKKKLKKMVVLATYYEKFNRSIEEEDKYYFKTGNSYTLIQSMDDLSIVFGVHEPELRNFMKTNKLKLKKNKENTLIRIAGYFDQISK